MKARLALIGSVGVPNNYGGFEMFADCCAPVLAREFDEVIVTCDSAKYADKNPCWKGVRRVFIPVRANGALSVIHDLFAFLAVFWRSKVIIVLGVSGGIFFPVFKLLCSFSGKCLIVNVDGIEWRRAKFSKLKRGFLYISDRLAQYFSDAVVIDNEGLRQYLISSVRPTARHIAYPGDHVQRIHDTNRNDSGEPACLTICRIEPENNCHLLIEAFAKAARGKYIFVGNWDASEYGRSLKERYKDCPGLEMRSPTYDRNELALLRESCNLYLHGHSVGGTNPSLVEMIFYDCRILAFDCSFNRFTGGASIDYFKDQTELTECLQSIDSYACSGREAVRELYSNEKISSAYIELSRRLLKPEKILAPKAPHVADKRI